MATPDYILLAFFGFLLFVAFCYFQWLRHRQKTGTPHIALAAVGVIGLIITTCIVAITNSALTDIMNAGLLLLGPITGKEIPQLNNWQGGLVAIIISAALATLGARYLFLTATAAIKAWNGPTTVTAMELEERRLAHNLFALAYAELKRLASFRSDPPASRPNPRPIELPDSLPWRDLARELLTTAFTEIVIPDHGWRAKNSLWFGSMYSSTNSVDPSHPVVAIVLPEKPSEALL